MFLMTQDPALELPVERFLLHEHVIDDACQLEGTSVRAIRIGLRRALALKNARISG